MQRLGLFGVAVLGLAACGPTTTTRTLALGDPCTPGDEVFVCPDLCLALDGASGFCTSPCTEDCPEGYVCQGAGRYGRVCFKATGCKEDVDCPAGHVCDTDTGNCYIKVNRSLCAPCQDTAQCAAGGACFKAVGSGEQFCTEPCGAGDTCPTGFECSEIPAGPNGELMKQCVPKTQSCSAGRPLCASCQGDNECGGAFDVCVRNVVSGETFCGRDCNPKKNVCPTGVQCTPELLDSAENPDCPLGFSCANLGGVENDLPKGPFQCVPNSNTCQGYCDAADDLGQVSQCGLGQLCAGNTCEPATDGRMCSPCTDNDDCRRGGFTENRCLVNNCPDCPYKGEAFCATPCSDTDACIRSFGPGFECKPVADPSGPTRNYCLPQRGTCASGLRRLGEDCGANGAADCVTGLCLKAGIAAFCSSPCTTDSQCGDTRYRCCEVVNGAYDCSEPHRGVDGPLSGMGVCAPLGGLFGDDCSPGRAPCQSGTCLDLGTARLCTETCPAGTCRDGFACRKADLPDGMSQVDVCFPNGGGLAGASCAFGPAACASGLCIRKDSGPICTQACQAVEECPQDWTCELLLSVTEQSVQACLPPFLQEG